MKKEWTIFAGLATVFLLAYYLNFTSPKIQNAIMEAFFMLQWYAQYHTLACVVPAMFIAGAIAVFFSKEAVLRHLGPKANKVEAYGVASTSGTVLAVCSCSVLPMFAGIYRVGAGLGPASAFLYFRTGHQCDGYFLDGPRVGLRPGHRADHRVGRVRGRHRIDHGGHLPQGGRGANPGRDGVARSASGQAKPLANQFVFREHDCFPGLQRLASARGQTILETKDGKTMHVAVLQKTGEMYRVQLEEPLDEIKKGQKITLGTADIVSEKGLDARKLRVGRLDIPSPLVVGRGLLAGHAGHGRPVVRPRGTRRMDGPDVEFLEVDHPLLFGGVFVTGFVGALIPEEIVAGWVGGDSIRANLIASMIGGMWYFATLTQVCGIQNLPLFHRNRMTSFKRLVESRCLRLSRLHFRCRTIRIQV